MTSILKVDSIQTAAGKPIVNATGSVLQVVMGTLTSQFTQSATNSSNDTGLSATITPSSTSSKIYITTAASVVLSSTQDAIFYLVRNNSNIVPMNMYTSTGYVSASQNFVFLDSPSTTSAVTYKVMCEKDAGELFFNYQNEQNSTAHMVLMEIAG